jgi:hypothetical protein
MGPAALGSFIGTLLTMVDAIHISSERFVRLAPTLLLLFNLVPIFGIQPAHIGISSLYCFGSAPLKRLTLLRRLYATWQSIL